MFTTKLSALQRVVSLESAASASHIVLNCVPCIVAGRRRLLSQQNTQTTDLYTPQKKRKMKELQVCAHTAEKEVKKLQERIEQCAEQKGVQIQPSLNDDFLAIMTENNSQVEKHFPEGSFRRISNSKRPRPEM